MAIIPIQPLTYASTCPHCQGALKANRLVWQGMHVCVAADCAACSAEILEDVRVGHAQHFPYQIDLQKNLIWGSTESLSWLGKPLLKSLQTPNLQSLEIQQEKFKSCRQAIVLNCIDFLYGHSLLKLLNAQKHLDHQPEMGLIVIVPQFLRWMVPEGVAEIWTVNLTLKQGQTFYPEFDRWVTQELQRFEQVYLSSADSHPASFDISRFTQIPQHNFSNPLRVTFVWREDRVWLEDFPFRVLKKLRGKAIILHWQNRQIRSLFARLRQDLPDAIFTVVGLGQQTTFPDWIEDLRVSQFDAIRERQTCQIYSQSRVVLGVHGSNLLLPSAHAGMTLDLMPDDRWGNIAQDILYQETDPRVASFRYRYVPANSSPTTVARIVSSMIQKYPDYLSRMAMDRSEPTASPVLNQVPVS
jgi:hypothetical protein